MMIPDVSLTKEESINERVIRSLYDAAESVDIQRFTSLFSVDGYFYDVSAGQKYVGLNVGQPVKIYAKAFPDMHRALESLVVKGSLVLVELSLNGTHRGDLVLPGGTIHPTGNRIQTPCCDVFRLEGAKVRSFHCYTAATILFAQLGVLNNLSAALASN